VTTPRRNRVDLHCHTTRSDGVLAPAELYAAARDYGMRLVAITDHDTLAGYRELRSAGLGARPSAAGPELVPGVEINAAAPEIPDLWEGELHILGFGVDPDDEAFEATLERQRTLRRERFSRIADRLRTLGMPVDDALHEALPTDVSSAGRPHLARALVLAGHASSVDDAMQRVLARGAPAYEPRAGLGPREAIEAIGRAGGLAALAHFPAAPEREGLIRELMGCGLRGLEVHYRGFDPATVEAMSAFADRLGLVATGGSDYHGDTLTYAEAEQLTCVPDAVGVRFLATLAGVPARDRR